jgi:hypothetical protein
MFGRRSFTPQFKSQQVIEVTLPMHACASVSGQHDEADLCRQHQIKPQSRQREFLLAVCSVTRDDAKSSVSSQPE